MRFKCSKCRATTTVRLEWGGEPVCPSCYLAERNKLDRLTFGASVAICNDRGICVYCGEGATDREHVVPRCTGLPTWVVPACRECNGLAGGTLFDGIIAKKRAVQAKLRRKHARTLATAEWDDADLSELGRGLRTTILAYRRAKAIVKLRVEWLLPGEAAQVAEEDVAA